MQLLVAFALVLFGLLHDPVAVRLAGEGSPILARWGLDGRQAGVLGVALGIVATAGFALAGLGADGILVPPDVVPYLAVASAVCSVALFGLFFRRWCVAPLAVDLAIVVVAVSMVIPAR